MSNNPRACAHKKESKRSAVRFCAATPKMSRRTITGYANSNPDNDSSISVLAGHTVENMSGDKARNPV